MKIYLDIDGTLIKADGFEMKEANHLKEFLEYIVNNHDVYWLTTHCYGNSREPVNYLSQYLTPDFIPILKKIKPTKWDRVKTDAIDLKDDFLWFDDYLTWEDENVLKSANKLSSFVRVNLDENPDIFLNYIKKD